MGSTEQHDDAEEIFERARQRGESFIEAVGRVVREAGLSIEEAKRIGTRIEFGEDLAEHQGDLADDLQSALANGTSRAPGINHAFGPEMDDA